MTDIRFNAFAAHTPKTPVIGSVGMVMKSIARWMGRKTWGLLKLFSLIPVTLGRAFEMAYVDPFANRSSHRDHERK